MAWNSLTALQQLAIRKPIRAKSDREIARLLRQSYQYMEETLAVWAL
jgi:hypothetical protein